MMATKLRLITSNGINYFFPLGKSILENLKNDLMLEKVTISCLQSDFKIISNTFKKGIEVDDLEKLNNFVRELEFTDYDSDILNAYYNLGVIKDLDVKEIENIIGNSIYHYMDSCICFDETYEEAIGRTLIECYNYLEIPENAKEFIDYKKVCKDALSKGWHFDDENYILVNTETIFQRNELIIKNIISEINEYNSHIDIMRNPEKGEELLDDIRLATEKAGKSIYFDICEECGKIFCNGYEYDNRLACSKDCACKVFNLNKKELDDLIKNQDSNEFFWELKNDDNSYISIK